MSLIKTYKLQMKRNRINTIIIIIIIIIIKIIIIICFVFSN